MTQQTGGKYTDLALSYAKGVCSGKILACNYVVQACERQLADLKKKNWQWKFSVPHAERICRFFELFPHVEGRWKSKLLQIEPWQAFQLTTIFGWVDDEGYRRFRKALVVLPRKNSKSTMAAVVGNFLFAADGEQGAQVFSAATTRDQASISWGIARRMAERTPGFLQRFGVRVHSHSITVPSTGSYFKPLSREANSLEGYNVHGAIIDELHAHGNREVYDVLDEATGARRQPLIYIISTEGDQSIGVFVEQTEYCKSVLSGNHKDDAYFGVIYTIDKGDDWRAPSSWKKANPNLGVSVYEKDLEVRCNQAIGTPDSQASFQTKRLCVRVGASQGFFNMLAWNGLCKDTNLKLEDFYGEPCYGSLDLASKTDLCASMLLFLKKGNFYIFGKYYIAEEAVKRGRPNYDFYTGWAASGKLILTPGDITDYDFIENDLLEIRKNFKILHFGYDPFQATKFVTDVAKKGIPFVEVPATVLQYSQPMKELAALIIAGKIKHNGDPVLNWMIGNVVAKKDAKDNVYPRKDHDDKKIDGAVALISAINLYYRQPGPKVSYYETAEASM